MNTIATVHSEGLAGEPKAGKSQVLVVDGADAGRAARVPDDGELVIGTDEDAGLRLTDDRVSGKHATIGAHDAGFRVRDLESTNGTLYEGSRIAEATVPLGATLKLGRTVLRIQPLPRALEVVPSQSCRFGELVAESLGMRELFAVLELAAASDVTVLLEGETGVGKELAARALHDESVRRRGPFVTIDCGSLPESLIESELFGHVRGAFTGASRGRKGAFTRAHGGTLVLDELDSVPASVQSRLLRAIESRTIRPVGSDEEHAIDVRLVAASQRDLSVCVANGTFRPDLYYRVSVVRAVIPPLRKRREDVAPIVAELLRRRGRDLGPVEGPPLAQLFAHDWPGNVRELRNVIERALVMSPRAQTFADLRLGAVGTGDATADPLAVRTELPFGEAKQAVVDAFERRYLADLLARTDGNLSAASRDAGMDRKHLRTLAQRHGLLPSGDASED